MEQDYVARAKVAERQKKWREALRLWFKAANSASYHNCAMRYREHAEYIIREWINGYKEKGR